MEGTTSKNAKLLATAGFLFITMIWGGSFVVMKNSVDLVPPSYLLALRFTLAAAFMALAFPGRMKKLDRGSLTCGLIMGIFLTLAYLFQTYGIKYTTASKNAFITAWCRFYTGRSAKSGRASTRSQPGLWRSSVWLF